MKSPTLLALLMLLCAACSQPSAQNIPVNSVSVQNPTKSPTSTLTPSPSPTPTLTPTPIPKNIVDGAELIYIPVGEFTMGNNQGSYSEQPVRYVFLDAYWIYKTEVTNSQFS
jgi:formylglycine-generating enzyme required for sulfatase activity